MARNKWHEGTMVCALTAAFANGDTAISPFGVCLVEDSTISKISA